MSFDNIIIKTEVTPQEVLITLKDGITLRVVCNPGYFHLSIAGMKATTGTYVSRSAYSSEAPILRLPDYMDIQYKKLLSE